MTTAESSELIAQWRGIGAGVRASLEALGEDRLDARPIPQAMTPRETAHHIAESNIVACSMIIAALACGRAAPACRTGWPR